MKISKVTVGEQYTYQRYSYFSPDEIKVVWKTADRTQFSKWHNGLNESAFGNIEKSLDIDGTYAFDVCDENANVAFVEPAPLEYYDYKVRLVNARWLSQN